MFSLLTSGSTLYAGCLGGIFRTTDSGENWTDLSSGLANYGILSLATNGSTLFAGTQTITQNGSPSPGILRSTDDGKTWTPANNGIEKIGNNYPAVFSLVTIGPTL